MVELDKGSRKPNKADNKIAHESQQDSDDDIHNAVGFGHVLGSFVHSLLIGLELPIVVLHFVQIDKDLLVDDVQILADVDSVVVQHLYAFQQVVHTLLDHVVDVLKSVQYLSLLKSLLLLLLQQTVYFGIILPKLL